MEGCNALPLEHWGLEQWPFSPAPRTEQLYPAAAFTEALARIEHLVNGRRRLGALLGPAGTGKSLTLQAAARQLARQGRAVAWVDALGISSRELLGQIAAGLGSAPVADTDAARIWRQIADRIGENGLQQVHSVLLLDDAGQAGPDVLTQLLRLARLDASHASRWTMVLTAEAPQALRWSESLRELIDLRIELREWELEETIGYIQTALVEAGRLDPLFEDRALEAIHALTRGVPRQVTRLADLALLAGAAAGTDSINAETIEAAHAELAWPAPAYST